MDNDPTEMNDVDEVMEDEVLLAGGPQPPCGCCCGRAGAAGSGAGAGPQAIRLYTYGRSAGAGTRRRIGGFAYAPDPDAAEVADGPQGAVDGPPGGASWTSSGRITNQLMELAAAYVGLVAIERFFDGGGGDGGGGGGNDVAPPRSLDVQENAHGSRQELGGRPPGTGGAGAGAGAGAGSARPSRSVVLVTTSHYVMSCMTHWLPRWQRTGWITKQQRVVQNHEVLKKMASIASRFRVSFERVDPGIGAAPTEGPRGLALVKSMVEGVLHDAQHAGCSKRHDVLCVWSG